MGLDKYHLIRVHNKLLRCLKSLVENNFCGLTKLFILIYKLSISTFNCITDLTVTQSVVKGEYEWDATANNGKGATVLKDAEGKLITEEYFTGKIIDVTGIVEYFDYNW